MWPEYLGTPRRTGVNALREEAVCFVLISNTPAAGAGSVSDRELFTIYKDRHTVENNFAFLEDPVFVNALFLKSPRRIEGLGLVLILVLFIWRLVERTMRMNLAATKSKVTGWEKRQTSRPTSLMMTTKFIGVFILVSALVRRLLQLLSDIQIPYLNLLEVTPDILIPPILTDTGPGNVDEKCSEISRTYAECRL
jgi:hypothetical protein